MKKSILFVCFMSFMVTIMSAANQKAALPDDSTYAVVNISVCNIRETGDFTSGMTTQALLGMPVRVLKYNGWAQIKTPDEYTGWVHRMAIQTMTRGNFEKWNGADKIVVTSAYGFTYEKADHHSQVVSDVVAGSRLKWIGNHGNYYYVSYPDGRKAYIANSIAMPEKVWRSHLKYDANSIVRTARSLVGIPYLWAGMSTKGMDCSGFVRTVLFEHDIIIPRDAWQQALVGNKININPDFKNLLPGDLIFFGRKATEDKKEHVSHVAIYIGNERFIHSLGYVHISSFNPKDKAYDKYNLNRLLFAVRFLPYINKEKGLNTTNRNPYYLVK